MSTWECRDCNEETEWSDRDVAERGTPVCPKCDEDMELVEDTDKLCGWVELGTFGVDSGQVLITDPCYVNDFIGNDKEDFDGKKIKEIQKSGKYPYSYNGACARTLPIEEVGKKPIVKHGGTIGFGCDGVVSETGWGDGEYTVYALMKEGRVKELKIKFF